MRTAPIHALARALALALAFASAWLALLVPGSAHAEASSGLTPTEQRWLQGAWPVIEHARQQQLPLDIVVQPQPSPGRAPLALGFVGGRCKLVLSMRGNPEAEATLARIEPDMLDATLALMAAHEIGHCRRWLEGAWNGLPAGFTASPGPDGLAPERALAWQAMQAARREEGYGDLAGLAWAWQHHRTLYPRLHAWLLAERLQDRIPGSPHDTVAWVRLAADGEPFGDAGWGGSGVPSLWRAGLDAPLD
jgi:hypothetical protein